MVTCKSCGRGNMEYKGNQATRKGVLHGFHCKNPECKLYDSWQTVDLGAWTMQIAFDSADKTAKFSEVK